jgi:hypothetical protein
MTIPSDRIANCVSRSFLETHQALSAEAGYDFDRVNWFYHKMAQDVNDHAPHLNDWWRDFYDSIHRQRRPLSERQQAVIHKHFVRAFIANPYVKLTDFNKRLKEGR